MMQLVVVRIKTKTVQQFTFIQPGGGRERYFLAWFKSVQLSSAQSEGPFVLLPLDATIYYTSILYIPYLLKLCTEL
jgi:hypothetical protein